MERRDFLKRGAALVAAGTVLGADSFLLHAHNKDTIKAFSKDIKNYKEGMQYRPMGRTGVYVSALGFGMLRLPMKDGKMLTEPSVEMVRHAIDNGLNYVDTAWMYYMGQSEAITGEALKQGYRDKVYVTSKVPWWMIERPEDFEKMFDESRKRIGTDVIDFYHFHFMSRRGLNEKIIPMKLIEKMENLKAKGKIRFSGFSFHDSNVIFKKVVDANPDWNFCLMQQNYLDTEHEAGLIGLKYAAARGMGVSIMEPLRNGYLARPPKQMLDAFDQADNKRNHVEWALDYLWNMPEVSIVVSGMSELQHVKDNLEYARRSSVNMLTPDDAEIIGRATRAFRSSEGSVPCTGCYYCLPCPQNVGIGYILSLVYNQYKANGNKQWAQSLYNGMAPVLRGEKADACVNCGKCIDKCPQGINIPEVLKKVRADLEV